MENINEHRATKKKKKKLFPLYKQSMYVHKVVVVTA